MSFVPTEKQVDSLNKLLKQFIRENIEVRLIRFMKLAKEGIKNCEIEVLCLEDTDRYIIKYDGTVAQWYRII